MSKDIESIAPAPTEEEISAVQNEQEATQDTQTEQVAEATQAAEKEAEKPDKPPEGFVPHKAFHAEREERKKLQAQIAQREQEWLQRQQVYEHRFQQIQEAFRQQNQPKPPSFDEDPVGALRYENETAKRELEQIKAWQAQQAQTQEQAWRQQQYFGQIANAVTQAESEFAKENPDYMEAVSHFKKARGQQLAALGLPPQEIANYVQQEAFQIADTALRNGRNPAEAAFEIAKAAGWQRKAPEAQMQDKMATLQKGVKAASSLGSGGAPAGKLTIEALAGMSDREFDEALKSGAWEKLGFN